MSRCVKCGRSWHANCHIEGHPDYDCEYQDPRTPGLKAVGRRMQRFNASPEGKEYRERAKETRGQPCQIVSPVCTGYAEHLHEPLSRGRAGGIEAALKSGPPPIPCCDACNAYVSEHPVWAREKGLLIRLSDTRSEREEIDL